MVYKRKRYGGFKRKRFGRVFKRLRRSTKRGSWRRRTVRSIIKVPAWPDQILVKLRYKGSHVAAFSGTGTSLGIFQHTYAGNSCYDPDVTLAGQQPLGYDNWSGMFKYCVVLASKIEVRASQTAGDTIINLSVWPMTDSDTTPDNTYFPADFAYARTAQLSLPSQGSGTQKVVKNYSKSAKMFGISSRGMKDLYTTYGHTIAANPNQMWFWKVFYQNFDGSAVNTSNVVMTEVFLTYYCWFTRRSEVNKDL